MGSEPRVKQEAVSPARTIIMQDKKTTDCQALRCPTNSTVSRVPLRAPQRGSPTGVMLKVNDPTLQEP